MENAIKANIVSRGKHLISLRKFVIPDLIRDLLNVGTSLKKIPDQVRNDGGRWNAGGRRNDSGRWNDGGHRNNTVPQQGFTLLELLIVLVIIGVVIAAVALSIHNSGSSQQSRSAANIFRARVMYAEQNAIIQSTTIGLAISQQGYQFYRLQNKPPTEVIYWQKADDNALRYQSWPSTMNLSLRLPDNPNALIPNQLPQQPMIIFNPSGGVTPFTLKIDHFTVQAKANGVISVK